MSDTPRTDEMADFARQLERELNEAIRLAEDFDRRISQKDAKLAELRKDKARLDWFLTATDEELNRLDEWSREAIDAAMEAKQ